MSFLEYVADDLITKFGTDLSRVAVVFPNKRASLFMNEHLARRAGKPIWSPAYITISDLFRRHSDSQVADPIKLVCDLHRCFVEQTGIEESLDHFYGWGQLLLADFDDIDKNMADADKVFANLRDIRELDDVSYLTDEQKKIIARFFSNFTDDHNSVLKQRFLQLWSRMGNIYHSFRKRLADQQLAYEGMLFREVVENSQFLRPFGSSNSETPESKLPVMNGSNHNSCVPAIASDQRSSAQLPVTDGSNHNSQFSIFNSQFTHYVFVGFNLLQQVEQRLFTMLKQQGKARFYWDFDHYYMQSEKGAPRNEAGHFIAQYLAHFPNELDIHNTQIYNQFSQPKDISFISAPTENIQARYISSWLRQGDRLRAGRRTAIVLCNEALLQTVIHCLPPEVEKVNVTTGYPLVQTPAASLVTQLLNLQTIGFAASRQRFRLRQVSAVLRHPYAVHISPETPRLLKELNAQKIFYPNRERLAVDEGTALLFTPQSENLGLLRWLCDLMQLVARQERPQQGTDQTGDASLFQESVFRTYTLLNRLYALVEQGDLQVDVVTLQRLIGQLISSTSVPFHGEPAEGLQIMGVLETRNLDFDHLLVLSCNEGNMPKGINDTSFIPYNIRKGYGLTTVDHKVAIYSYYFHRLLQRASDVTLLYNNATADGQTGEMSRFMLQLMAESGHSIAFRTLQSSQAITPFMPPTIEKTPAVMDILQKRFSLLHHPAALTSHPFPLLTPTAVNCYMRCPLQFYYNYVCGLREPDETDDDTIDNRVFGNIFHEASRTLYIQLMQRGGQIRKGDIEQLLKSEVEIERAVDEAFRTELFQLKTKPAGYHMELNGFQLINREVIIHYVRQLLEVDRQLAPFSIIGLECDVVAPFSTPNLQTVIGGRIDRLDRITLSDGSERIRVIDYKTGSRQPVPLADVDAIFSPDSLSKHSDYYLQTFLYGLIVRRSAQYNPDHLPVSPALLFIQHAGTDEYNPVLFFGKNRISDVAEHGDRFSQLLEEKVTEMFQPDTAFVPTDDRQRCTSCPYYQLCRG